MSWQPDWICPPGETLLELLELRGWTQAHLARELGFSLKHVNRVIKGHENISALMAIRLEYHGFGTAEFWVHRDADFRLAKLRRGVIVS